MAEEIGLFAILEFVLSKMMHSPTLLLVAVLLPLTLYLALLFLHRFAASQCFTRVLPSTPNHGLETVPRLQTISPERLEADYVKTGIPLVVTGAMSEWPAMNKWTFEWFGVRLGGLRKDK